MQRSYRKLHGASQKEQASHTRTALQILDDMERECERQVDNLIEIGVKIEGLSGVLEHPCYRKWRDIAKKAKTVVDPGEVIRYWKIFEAERTHPEKDFSNYLDAVNVASFYALSRGQTSGRSNMSYFPLFASGTHVVLNAPRSVGMKSHLRPSLLEEVIHPVSIQYLTFATAMEKYTEHDIKRQSVHAINGLKGIQKLRRRFRKLWMEANSKFALAQRSDKDEYLKAISLGQLTELESFREFSDAYSDWKTSFNEVVGSIFFSVSKTDQQIRETYTSIKQRILRDFKEQQQTDAILLSNAPANTITAAFNWSRLASLVESRLLLLHDNIPRSIEEVTLKSLRDAEIITEAGEVFPDARPTLRTSVLLTEIQQMLFYWERTVGFTAQLCCWEYALNLTDMLGSICSFLAKAHDVLQGEVEVTLKVYGTDIFRVLTTSPFVGKDELFDQILTVTRTPHYLRLDSKICSIFLDVAPPDPTTGLEVAVMYERTHLHPLIGELYENTATLSMPSLIISSLLEEYAKEFRRKEQRIRTFAESLKERTILQSGSFTMVP
jgi:hypothetical protein